MKMKEIKHKTYYEFDHDVRTCLGNPVECSVCGVLTTKSKAVRIYNEDWPSLVKLYCLHCKPPYDVKTIENGVTTYQKHVYVDEYQDVDVEGNPING